MKHTEIGVPRRRDEALAFIVDRVTRTGIAPSYEELARALGVGKSRATELVKQLIAAGLIEKSPGAQRALIVRDVVRARNEIDGAARDIGWTVATPLGELQQPPTHVHLPVLPPFEHLPDVD